MLCSKAWLIFAWKSQSGKLYVYSSWNIGILFPPGGHVETRQIRSKNLHRLWAGIDALLPCLAELAV